MNNTSEQDKELNKYSKQYQAITDILFNNGGVNKKIVDELTVFMASEIFSIGLEWESYISTHYTRNEDVKKIIGEDYPVKSRQTGLKSMIAFGANYEHSIQRQRLSTLKENK